MTAQPTPRERARPDFPAVVHTYTDVLRVLRDQGDRTAAELAQATGRVLSNVRRDLHKLVAADVVALSTDFASLTDKGRQWLAGMDVAQGGAPAPGAADRGPHIVVPLDQLEFNPDNPRSTIRDVEGLADSIVADADQGGPGVIQPLSVSPPDANGVRIVWAGNRRLAAVRLLAEQNRLPAALVDGLPCVERKAAAAQALLLAIVENGQRADLSPLEDARALAALADASGWSAREVAKQTGRSPADSEAGVRDVQLKIKIAREATPEAIAEYERTGSWDALRDSVARRVEQTEPSGRGEEAAAPEPSPLAGEGGARDAQAAREGEGSHQPEQTDIQVSDPLVVNGVRHPNLTRANEARRAIEGQCISIAPAPRKPASTAGEFTSVTYAEQTGAGPNAAIEEPVAEAAPADPWGRDANEIVADKALRLKAEDLALGRATGSAEWARDLLAAAGVSGPFGVADTGVKGDANIVAFDATAGVRPLLTVDVNGDLPDERAEALALLFAWALNRGFNEGATS